MLAHLPFKNAKEFSSKQKENDESFFNIKEKGKEQKYGYMKKTILMSFVNHIS